MKKMFRSALLLAQLSIFTLSLQGQDAESLQKRMALAQKIKDESSNNLLSAWTFEEWQTYYTLTHQSSEDLTQFGFDLYSKFTQNGRKYGIIKLPKDTLTRPLFESINGAFEGGVVVTNGNKVGMVDSVGKLIIPTQYDEIFRFNDDRGFVKQNNKYALVTYSGKILTPFMYDAVAGFSDKTCAVMVKGKVGYIDIDGKNITQPQFTDITNFYHGFAKIYYDKWEQIVKAEIYKNGRPNNVNVGYTKSIPFLINKRGAKIFTGQDGDMIFITENDFAIIGRNQYINGDKIYSESVIDTTGKVIIPFDRKVYIKYVSQNWFVITNSITNLMGIFDFKGKELLKTSFIKVDNLKYNNKTLGKVYFDTDNFFYINKDCKCVEFDGVKCPDAE